MPIQLPISFEFRANQTFDDFYPGANQEIIQHLRQATDGMGEQFIYLWGESGHGKSHLLQACCHDAAKISKSIFFLDLTDPDNNTPNILTGLEAVEMVCLDNIDAITGQDRWEMACFNLFNRVREQHHCLIVSASCPAKSLNINLPDLKTRFNWGLALKLLPLDDDEKAAALIHKAQRIGIELSPHAARFLLSRHDRNLASLWLILDKLDCASLAAKRKLTIPFLKQVLEQSS